MNLAMAAAGTACDCLCSNEDRLVPERKRTFCAEINELLLHPSGYDCYATITRPEGGQGLYQCVIVVQKRPRGPDGEYLQLNGKKDINELANQLLQGMGTGVQGQGTLAGMGTNISGQGQGTLAGIGCC